MFALLVLAAAGALTPQQEERLEIIIGVCEQTVDSAAGRKALDVGFYRDTRWRGEDERKIFLREIERRNASMWLSFNGNAKAAGLTPSETVVATRFCASKITSFFQGMMNSVTEESAPEMALWEGGK